MLGFFLLATASSQAQWLTQTIELKPGWNAVYLHVTATNDTLENVVGPSSPISDIWLWQPNLSQGRIISNPLQPISGSDWLQWSKAVGPANAFALVANSTYLVRNNSGSSFSWNLKGNPVPPVSHWASSGLNFIGFATRSDTPPSFSNFLAPALSARPFDIFFYPGGESSGASPNTSPLYAQATTPVTRGQAYWIKKQDNSDNQYFGPFEVVLQNYKGVHFSTGLGTYSFRLRNQTSTTNRIIATLLASETTPSGDSIPTPPLLLRTSLDISTLKYGHTNLPVNTGRTFTLSPKGKPGSEVEVVIGLDRANMSGTNGAPFAGTLRLQDSTLGHLQVDLPVTAFQGSNEGLWVGNASISQVGNYLKTYAKATNAADFANQIAQFNFLNEANKSVTLPAGLWTPHDFPSGDLTSVATNHSWSAAASSADGTHLVAAVNGGQIYTSTDAGTSWTPRETSRSWRALASSADGTNVVAVVWGGQIYTSTDSGVTWVPRDSDRAWTAVASSADGTNLVASVTGGQLYTSTDAGLTWTPQESNRLWSSVASSADGTNLVAAVSSAQLYTSTDAGLTWTPRDAPRGWVSVASSADGTNLLAAVNSGRLYTSTNAGVSWVARDSDRAWVSVASSADGTNSVAAVTGGQIYTSADAGASWTPREASRDWTSVATSSNGANLIAVNGTRIFTSTNSGTLWNIVSPLVWSCLASSANGTNLVAALSGGPIYTSSDAGQSWIPQVAAPLTNWQAMASSAGGTNLVAVVKGGLIYLSTDSGVNWAASSAPSANWQSVASSGDGLKLVALVDVGDIYTSIDGGSVWTKRSPLPNQHWQSVASSGDGKKLLAAIKGGQLYSSTNSGVAWAALIGAPTANWQSVASSADGKMLVAAESPGAIYASTDFGTTWDLRSSAPPAANWQSIVSSTNGNSLVAAVNGGRIYTSDDAGNTWTARESIRGWTAVASSADGTRLVAGEAAGDSQLYTTVGTLSAPTLVYDTNSNLILSGGRKYLTATFDTELGDVPSPFPLRLIVHQGSNGVTRLLQHAFVGPDAVTSNSIITLEEGNLHPGLLSKARRITSVHLPLSNTGWVLKGDFAGVGIMNTVLTDGFDNQASNPFVHSYHPDHDNLDALFRPIGKPGVESYDIKRQITLAFTPPGDDFASLTVGSSSLQGTYLENIVLKGTENQTRTVVTKGTFTLNRVTSIPSIK